MSYNSRTNLAENGAELPIEEFMKIFTSACLIGWENIKQNPPKIRCQFHGDKSLSDDKGQCVCKAEFQTAILDSQGNPQPILLCAYHLKKLSKQLGIDR